MKTITEPLKKFMKLIVTYLIIKLLVFYRIEKERAKFQQEVYELLSQIEITNKEKVRLLAEIQSETLFHSLISVCCQ